MAFIKEINPIGSGEGEDGSVHQTNPSCILTFIRWQQRDTLRTSPTEDQNFLSTRGPLVVENDCLQVNVVSNKGTFTSSLNATLIMSDVNYATSLHPGDFVFVNILNWEKDATRVAINAKAGSPINGIEDGFKGLFRIQSIRTTVAIIDPEKGTKAVVFKISGFAFSEFNSTIYFNEHLFAKEEKDSQLLFLKNLKNDWKQIVDSLRGDKDSNIQNLMKFLVDAFVGLGTNDPTSLGTPHKNLNAHFSMPSIIGKLLGIKDVKAAKDINNYIFGIQQYGINGEADLATGMNPSDLQKQERNFWITKKKCQGFYVPTTGFWNNEKAWGIMTQFVNSPLNEMYTCFKVSPTGSVMPTIIFRQIPFTTEDFQNTMAKKGKTKELAVVTRFTNLPRWRLNPALVTSTDLGMDDAARINYVQYTGNSYMGGNYTAMEAVAQGNYLYDIDDVKRSGLRPAIFSTSFDVSPTSNGSKSRVWAKIIGDALMGGHMWLNGTLVSAGIVDPIAVGENLEFDGTIYHIEQVNHSFVLGQDAKKTFRTIISVSHGISTATDLGRTRYAEMIHSNAYSKRKEDFQFEGILPGISENQEISDRDSLEPSIKDDPGAFQQPDSPVSIVKRVRNERPKPKKGKK